MIYRITINEEGRCVDPCPHKQKIPSDVPMFGGDEIRVGSHFCVCCEWNANFGQSSKKDNKVYCIFKELKKHRAMMKEFAKDNETIRRKTDDVTAVTIGVCDLVRIGLPGRDAIVMGAYDMSIEETAESYMEKMKADYRFTFNRTYALFVAALIGKINRLLHENKWQPLIGNYFIQDTHGLSTDWMLAVEETENHTYVANVVPFDPDKEIKCRPLYDYSSMY